MYFDSNIKSEKKFTAKDYGLDLSTEMNYDSNTNDYTFDINNQNFIRKILELNITK